MKNKTKTCLGILGCPPETTMKPVPTAAPVPAVPVAPVAPPPQMMQQPMPPPQAMTQEQLLEIVSKMPQEQIDQQYAIKFPKWKPHSGFFENNPGLCIGLVILGITGLLIFAGVALSMMTSSKPQQQQRPMRKKSRSNSRMRR